MHSTSIPSIPTLQFLFPRPRIDSTIQCGRRGDTYLPSVALTLTALSVRRFNLPTFPSLQTQSADLEIALRCTTALFGSGKPHVPTGKHIASPINPSIDVCHTPRTLTPRNTTRSWYYYLAHGRIWWFPCPATVMFIAYTLYSVFHPPYPILSIIFFLSHSPYPILPIPSYLCHPPYPLRPYPILPMQSSLSHLSYPILPSSLPPSSSHNPPSPSKNPTKNIHKKIISSRNAAQCGRENTTRHSAPQSNKAERRARRVRHLYKKQYYPSSPPLIKNTTRIENHSP